jgi:hypothetical protein
MGEALRRLAAVPAWKGDIRGIGADKPQSIKRARGGPIGIAGWIDQNNGPIIPYDL